MSIISSFLAAVCTAVMLSFGIPNEYLHFGSGYFGFAALIPIYIAFCFSPSRRRSGLMYGAVIALIHLISSFWLAYFENFAIFTLGASTVAYFCLGSLFGVWFYYAMQFPIRVRPFAFAVLWTLWEWFKGSGFVAYPWGSLSMTTLSLLPFIQIADITGIWGITFLVALTSAVFTELCIARYGLKGLQFAVHTRQLYTAAARIDKKQLYAPAVFTAALLVLVNGYGLYRLCERREVKQNLSLVLVQQNTDPWVSGLHLFFNNLSKTQAMTEAAIEASPVKPDLIVWNESSLAYGYDQFRDYYNSLPESEPFTDFLQRMNIPILTGSPLLVDAEQDKYSNAVYMINPDGSIADTYSKIQLICFAEYIPFLDHPLVQRFFSSLVGFSSGWEPGKVYKTMALDTQNGNTIRFAAPICFEDAFPALCADLHNQNSDILINLTNDSWSKTASAEYQHFAVAYFRAIELRTPLVRATNGGYTCVVDPRGFILTSLPLFTSAAIPVQIPIYTRRQTVYAQWKDWLPALFLVLACSVSIVYRLSPAFSPKTELDDESSFAWLTPLACKQRRKKKLLKKLWIRKRRKQQFTKGF
ncbi:MAG: apolipoprotein N-acyltransferase [Treponema sp.]|uniref:apolipoprotein N-acyltransferase n=1 Tax=Treponema sp. TaxID=166 RepID=UPI003FA2E4BF